MNEEIEKKETKKPVAKKTTTKATPKKTTTKSTTKKSTDTKKTPNTTKSTPIKKAVEKKEIISEKVEVKETPNMEVKKDDIVSKLNADVDTKKLAEFFTKDMETGHHGLAIISLVFGVMCMIFIWVLPIISLFSGILGAIFSLFSISEKRSTIGVAAVGINIASLSLLLFYFIVCMVIGVSKYALM